MLIDVTKIKKIAGKPFPFKVEDQWTNLDYQGETLTFLGPVTLEGTATNTGRTILVEGKLSVAIQRECSRCLEVLTQSLQIAFTEEYVHVVEKPEHVADDDQAEKLLSFTGNSIDLTNEVREAILLELPIRGLCREDCLGLCPICGQNLNAGACGCQQKKLDPRLQVLEKLLKP